MIDFDVYCPSPRVENLLQSLRIRLNKDFPTTKVYISTANPYNNWLEKLYNFYYKKEEENE